MLAAARRSKELKQMALCSSLRGGDRVPPQYRRLHLRRAPSPPCLE